METYTRPLIDQKLFDTFKELKDIPYKRTTLKTLNSSQELVVYGLNTSYHLSIPEDMRSLYSIAKPSTVLTATIRRRLEFDKHGDDSEYTGRLWMNNSIAVRLFTLPLIDGGSKQHQQAHIVEFIQHCLNIEELFDFPINNWSLALSRDNQLQLHINDDYYTYDPLELYYLRSVS